MRYNGEHMLILYIILLIIVLCALIGVASIRPSAAKNSVFELERRAREGDESAKIQLRVNELSDDVRTIQRIITALFLIAFVLLSIAVFGWLFGALVAIYIALQYPIIARLSLIHRNIQPLYERAEPAILRFIGSYRPLFTFLRGLEEPKVELSIESREELEHLVKNSKNIFTTEQQKLLHHGLTFSDRRVREVMTPRSVVETVSADELLGPLVLHDLHKTGYSRFPVIDGDIDHIVGMLYVQKLLSLDVKKSLTVKKAMDSQVFYIHEDQTLGHALSAFIRTHHHLFIVVNEYRETVGVLGLEDVIEALLGRKIIDEFDAHDDLRAVATRNPRQNNSPVNKTDV